MSSAKDFEVRSFDDFLEASDAPDSVHAIEQINAIFQQGPVYNFSSADEESIKTLTHLASSFVYYRFLQHNRERYIDWRLAQGDRFRDSETLYIRWQIAMDYPDLIGKPFPENPSVRDVFIRFADVQRSLWGDVHTPVGLAIDPESVLVSTAYFDPVIGDTTAHFDDDRVIRYWITPQAGTHRNWFTSQADAMIEEHPLTRYEIGTVGMTLAFANGDRRTLTLGFRRISPRSQWHIGSLSVSNPSTQGGLIEY
ncbi:MAG: hypothetical protein ACWA5W_01450 [Phycisphaerales bacterium]